MAEKPQTTIATRMSGIREDWLRLTQEEILEPDLPIVDPHHHLWDFPSHRYLLPELLADTGSGHRIEQTVFIECTAMFRADGPPEMRTLGETEFVNGIAAMSARFWSSVSISRMLGRACFRAGVRTSVRRAAGSAAASRSTVEGSGESMNSGLGPAATGRVSSVAHPSRDRSREATTAVPRCLVTKAQ